MLKVAEKLFVIAMLFYLTDAVYPFLAGYQSRYSRLEGNSLDFVLQTVFYAGAFFFMAIQWRSLAQNVWKVKWIVALILVAMASAAWSQDPMFTLRRSMVLVATTAFGIYFGSRFTVPQQLRLLAWTCALVVVASILIALLFPQYGLDHTTHSGDWQGAFIQKNVLARAMVFAAMVFYFSRTALGQAFRWGGIAVSFVVLFLSHSVTGALVFLAVIATLPLYSLLRTHITLRIPAVIALILIGAVGAVFITSSLPEVFQLVNRSPKLTGRTDLWNAIWLSIDKRLWLGYGFNGFWQGMTGESATVLETVQWTPLHAHNGFLDLLLDLGVLGFITFAVGYIALWRRALAFNKRARGPVPLWLCTYLAFMLFYNFTESSILASNNIFWMLYTATAVSLFNYLPDLGPQTQMMATREP